MSWEFLRWVLGGRGGSNGREGGLDELGQRAILAHYLGRTQGVAGSLFPCTDSTLSSLLAPVSPQAPILGQAQRRTLLVPALGFSWQDPPWRLFLLDEASPDPSSPPQVPIKCSKYFLLLNKANKGKGSLEA